MKGESELTEFQVKSLEARFRRRMIECVHCGTLNFVMDHYRGFICCEPLEKLA